MINKEELKIVFMGTPGFAVESLRLLVENKYKVVAVVTMPDKPAGRGQKLQYSPVKQYALEHELRLLQPEKLKDDAFLNELSSLNADLQIVVAFRMLPEVVWNMPRLGTFNLHASLLPDYRGAAPINWAIIRGEKRTGATTFFLTHEIDTGNIILQQELPILETDNAGSLHDKLMVMGAEMVIKTVERICKGKPETIDQQEMLDSGAEIKLAPKIFKELCEIKPDFSLKDAHNFVRGLSPYPTAWVSVQLPGQDEKVILKVFETHADSSNHRYTPGTFILEKQLRAGIALSDGILWFVSVQAPGKKRMLVQDWLRGLRL